MFRRLVLGIGSLLWLTGCVSYGVYSGPQTVEPGVTEVGVGTMLARSSEWGPEDPVVALAETALLLRHGVAPNFDLGARLWFFPVTFFVEEDPAIGLYADARYRFIDDRWMLTGSAGVSAFSAGGMISVGAYPTILFGTERVYAGLRGILLRVITDGGHSDPDDPQLSDWAIGVVSGASFGDRWVVRPELNLYLRDVFSTVLLTPGVSLHRRF